MALSAVVRVAPGSGLLARRPEALLHLMAPDQALLDAFEASATGRERAAVAAAAAGAGLAVAPFVCVTWGVDAGVMAFGDVVVRTDQPSLPMLSGSGSRTWVERSLPDGEPAVVEGGDVSDVDGTTDLVDGVVPAGGFRLELEDDEVTLPPLAAATAVGVAPAGPPRRVTLVDARSCADGHPNPPALSVCDVCGAPLQPAVAPVALPSLGRLVLDDGVSVELDADVLIGRRPDREAAPERAGLRRLAVGGDKVSRCHLEVRRRGWDVLIDDCGSTNGTFVVAPEGVVAALEPGRPQLVEPGTVVHFGSRSFTVRGRA